MVSCSFLNDCKRWGLMLNIGFKNGVKWQVVLYSVQCTLGWYGHLRGPFTCPTAGVKTT